MKKLIQSVIIVFCTVLFYPVGCNQMEQLDTKSIFTVQFHIDDETVIQNQQVKANESPHKPETPEKNGFVFDGWYKKPDYLTKFVFGTDRITQDTILYGRWVITEQYTVTFDSKGGTSVSEITNILKDTIIRKPDDPVKEGHVFRGWYKDAAYNSVFNFETDSITEDLTLHARWKEVPSELFTVKFETNGGTTVPSQSVIEGATVDKPADPLKTGVVFGGWFTDAGCYYEFDFSTPINSDTTLYALWESENGFTITFDTGHGGPLIRSRIVASGERIAKPADPVRPGYTFGGWYEDSSYMTVYDFNNVVTSDMTLHGKWTVNIVNRYFINFETNGGTSIPKIVVYEGTAIKAPVEPTRTGYTFRGWYTDKDLTEGNEFNFASDTVDTNLILYAGWERNTYTVTFDANGGKFTNGASIDSQLVQYDESVAIPEKPEKTGVVFLGWHTVSVNQTTENQYAFTEKVSADITLYARWSTGTVHTITFHSNGGSSVAAIHISDGSMAVMPPAPTWEGHTFKGWFTDDESFSDEFDFSTTIINENKTLYAKWATNPTGLKLKEISAGDYYGQLLLTGATNEDEAKLFIQSVNNVFPGFLAFSWGDASTGYRIGANTNPTEGLDHACIIPGSFEVDFSWEGKYTDVGNDGCTYPNPADSGSTGGGDETGITGPDTINLNDIEFTIIKDTDGNYVTEIEPITGTTMFLLESSDTVFDGLTTVEDSVHAEQTGSYFMGYHGVWGQAFMSSFYRNNQGAYALSNYFGPVEGTAIFKLHDDDIMKNGVFSGAPAMYSHLTIAFLNPAMSYTKGSYDLTSTGLSYTYYPAMGKDSRFGLLNLKEQIRVANRRNQKVILAMGGATYHDWAEVATEGNAGTAGPHVQALADLLLDLNADGLDVDYERHQQYGSDPEGTTEELRGAIKALRMAVDLANQLDDDKKDRILTIAAWSTGADYSANSRKYKLTRPGSQYTGIYTQADKDAAKAALDDAVANGADDATRTALAAVWNNIIVGEPKMTIWTGGAGMHRHAFEDTTVKSLIDVLAIMAYDASYHYFDPVQAWQLYREMMPEDTPVLLGLEQAPEGWNDGQVLVRNNSDAGPVGTIFENDSYGNPLTNAYYSVERLTKFVAENKVNVHDGAMVWTMTARDDAGLSMPQVDSKAAAVAATALDIAEEAAIQLSLPTDSRSHSTWTVLE